MQKRTIIKKINAIIKEHGSFTTADVQAESSPSVSAKRGRNELCESFDFGKTEVVSYDINDDEVDSEYMNYEDLSKDILEEILFLAEIHEVESLQTEKRISN